MFDYEHCLTYQIHVSDEKFENYLTFLLIMDGNNLDYVYAKDFNSFMYNKTKSRKQTLLQILFAIF